MAFGKLLRATATLTSVLVATFLATPSTVFGAQKKPATANKKKPAVKKKPSKKGGTAALSTNVQGHTVFTVNEQTTSADVQLIKDTFANILKDDAAAVKAAEKAVADAQKKLNAEKAKGKRGKLAGPTEALRVAQANLDTAKKKLEDDTKSRDIGVAAAENQLAQNQLRAQITAQENRVAELRALLALHEATNPSLAAADRVNLQRAEAELRALKGEMSDLQGQAVSLGSSLVKPVNNESEISDATPTGTSSASSAASRGAREVETGSLESAQ